MDGRYRRQWRHARTRCSRMSTNRGLYDAGTNRGLYDPTTGSMLYDCFPAVLYVDVTITGSTACGFPAEGTYRCWWVYNELQTFFESDDLGGGNKITVYTLSGNYRVGIGTNQGETSELWDLSPVSSSDPEGDYDWNTTWESYEETDNHCDSVACGPIVVGHLKYTYSATWSAQVTTNTPQNYPGYAFYSGSPSLSKQSDYLWQSGGFQVGGWNYGPTRTGWYELSWASDVWTFNFKVDGTTVFTLTTSAPLRIGPPAGAVWAETYRAGAITYVNFLGLVVS